MALVKLGVKRPGKAVWWLPHEGLCCLGYPAVIEAWLARDLNTEDERDAKVIAKLVAMADRHSHWKLHARIIEARN